MQSAITINLTIIPYLFSLNFSSFLEEFISQLNYQMLKFLVLRIIFLLSPSINYEFHLFIYFKKHSLT